MENVSSDQLKALLAGELSTEQESAIENALERDAVLLDRLERLSGSGHWLKGGAAVPIEIISPSLQSAIERVVSESGIERLSTDQSESEVIDLDVSKSDGTSSNESL